jgi:tripartite-type tricarboxylate transporter receptor subunit TctC
MSAVLARLLAGLALATLSSTVPARAYPAKPITFVIGFSAAGTTDIIALVKANPGQYFYGSTGSGTTSHISGELMKILVGLDITHVPYKGAVALNDLLSGEQIAFMFATIPSAIQHVRSGKLKVLAVSSLSRSASMPEVPAIAEAIPGFDASSWFGVVGPAGLPTEIANRLSGEIARIGRIPEIREKLVTQGADPVGGTPEEFAAYMRQETAKWARVVKASGAKAE